MAATTLTTTTLNRIIIILAHSDTTDALGRIREVQL